MIHEHKVQNFYDAAHVAYRKLMGDNWHHEEPDAIACGLGRQRGQEMLEERIATLVQLAPGKKALDWGCGIGGPTCHMAKFSGASFIAFSNNERLNVIARERAARLGLSEQQVSFRTLEDTGYKNLPFEDNTFDAVTFFESTCHATDKQTLFREVARVLKPGGRVAGADWIARPHGDYQTEEQIEAIMGPVNEWTHVPHSSTVESYRKHMETVGLKVMVARDLFAGIPCFGTVTDEERAAWLNYEGPEKELFRKGEETMVAARIFGVFSVGLWAAAKP